MNEKDGLFGRIQRNLRGEQISRRRQVAEAEDSAVVVNQFERDVNFGRRLWRNKNGLAAVPFNELQVCEAAEIRITEARLRVGTSRREIGEVSLK